MWKGSIWNRLLCWHKINAVHLGSNCFHKGCHCTLRQLALQPCLFVSWHTECHTCTATHTPVMNLLIIWSILSHRCCAEASRCLSWTIQTKGNILHHKFWGAESRKGSEVLFDIKRERLHSNQNEGSNWFGGGADLTPADLTAWPGHPRCASWASVMQSILVRRQTTDVASCRFQLIHQPLTLPPHDATDAAAGKDIQRHKYEYKSSYRAQKTDQHSWGLFETCSCSSCVKNKSNWPAPAKPHNAIET